MTDLVDAFEAFEDEPLMPRPEPHVDLLEDPDDVDLAAIEDETAATITEETAVTAPTTTPTGPGPACAICTGELPPGRTRFCSDACSKANDRQLARARHAKARAKSAKATAPPAAPTTRAASPSAAATAQPSLEQIAAALLATGAELTIEVDGVVLTARAR